MKRLIAMAVLIAFIITVCVLGSYFANHSCDKTKKELELIKNTVEQEDYTRAEELILGLEKDWRRRKELLSVFVNHGLLDDASDGIHRLKGFISDKSFQNFLSEYEFTHNALDLIIHEQKLTPESFY